jgi:hypothetical protein
MPRKKTAVQLDREIAEFFAQHGPTADASKLLTQRDALRAREINAILQAADGRNVYLIRTRLGNETVSRISQARTKARILQVRDLSTGFWTDVMPERNDKLEVR